MMERYEEAVESYDRALAAGKLDRVVRGALLQNKGSALVKLKAYEEAVVSLKQAREVDPGLLTVHLVMASALYGMRKFERAEQEVVSYISLCGEAQRVKRVTLGHDPDIPNALVLLARCCLAQGQLEEARKALEDALHMDKSKGDAHVLLGKVAFEQLKFGQAAVHYEEAIRIYPDEERLRFELARAYVACGSTDKAIRTLEGAIQNGMERSGLLKCLGVLKIKQKD